MLLRQVDLGGISTSTLIRQKLQSPWVHVVAIPSMTWEPELLNRLPLWVFASVFPFRFGRFNYKFDKEEVGPDFSDYLKTECSEDEVCAGSLFPSLQRRFPKSYAEVYVKALRPPKIDILKGIESGIITLGDSLCRW